ncbi:SIR2 family NAD-dependent protein deacylase [Nocardioides xinjiangensis]|uniref:hypothetical protein n=1 Tax=Nocardioides xinjiangensis TaxID=2817376 RepID=UPI001B3066A4|nr:hypothetical protein [Nocardioides sp. SYSU D00514]
MTHTSHTHAHHYDSVRGSQNLDAAAAALADAERVFIGAGAGLSAAAGYDYTDRDRFADLFPWLKKAGFNARYELIGYPLPPRHQWGFWAVHVRDIRLGNEPSAIYQQLRTAVGERDHFVMSSNVDGLFARNGFDPDLVFTPQGDYALYQCHSPCTREVWDARPILERAHATLDPQTGQIDEDAVPTCPNCGGEVYLNVNAGRFYIADHFAPTGRDLQAWLRNAQDTSAKVAVLDIGSGYNTPGVIRWPIEQITRALPHATLIRINRDHPDVPGDLTDRAFSLSGDAQASISHLTRTNH